jgi:CheY-like chemotaxis protein
MSAVLVNLFWTSRNSRKRLEKLIILEKSVVAMIKQANPSINISAHIGNWEMLSQACVLHGIPMMTVAKEVGTSAMNQRLCEVRSVIGQKIVQKEIVTPLPTPSVELAEDDVNFDSNELLGKNILLVDDDSRNIFTLTSILESAEAEVFSAFNGQEAMDFLEEGQSIDLILMDIMMPVMDGIEAIKNIKSNDKFKDLPIIAITAKNMPEDRQKCIDAGASEYLAKPLNHSALVTTIKAWIK